MRLNPKRPRRALSCALLVAVAAWPPGGDATARQAPPTFRATAEIVRLQVAVFAEDGGVVPDLDVSDFTVLEDGEERPITAFFPPDDGPIELALAMDVSGSMSFWDSRPVFHALLDSLHPDSCVLLIPFKETVGQGVWGRPGEPRLRAMVDEIPQDGEAEAIFDALIAAFVHLRERAAGGPPAGAVGIGFTDLLRYRSSWPPVAPVLPTTGQCEVPARDDTAPPLTRAVTIVTDQQDSASIAALEDALLAAWGSGIPVFALAISVGSGRLTESSVAVRLRPWLARDPDDEPLAQLARYTGGLVVRGTRERRGRDRRAIRLGPRERTALEGVERLGAALRGRYVLGFVPRREPGAEEALVTESEIEIRVDRDDVEVLTSASHAAGRGKSQGAALDTALRGFRALEGWRTEEALALFEAAASAAPELGLTHYGRALALSAQGRPADSLPAFAEARRLAPWLPDLDARVAAAHLAIGDADAAWEHALRGHYRGSTLPGLLDDLQRVAPRAVDLDRPPLDPRVAVRSDGKVTVYEKLASDRFVAIVWNLAATSEVMHGGWDPLTSDLLLRVRINDGAFDGLHVSVRGVLVLVDRDGQDLAKEDFRVHDYYDLETTASELLRAFEEIEAAVAAFHEETSR